jgi:hypothetical protein
MENYNKTEKMNFYNQRKLESGTTWILFLLLGWYYGSVNQMGKQVFFYLTLGGLGLWSLYLLFTLSGKIKKHNRAVAEQVGLSNEDIAMLGLN